MNDCKGCSGCKRTLPLSEFQPRLDRAPGQFSSRCNECRREAHRKRSLTRSKESRVRKVHVTPRHAFSAFMAGCAAGGGDANAPTIIDAKEYQF